MFTISNIHTFFPKSMVFTSFELSFGLFDENLLLLVTATAITTTTTTTTHTHLHNFILFYLLYFF